MKTEEDTEFKVGIMVVACILSGHLRRSRAIGAMGMDPERLGVGQVPVLAALQTLCSSYSSAGGCQVLASGSVSKLNQQFM